MKQLIISLLLTICLLLSHAFALPSDAKQRAQITADQITYNYETDTSFYRGHVNLVQGTTHLRGNIVTIYRNPVTNEVIKMIAIGNLAEYQTIPNPQHPKIIARAKRIEFYPPLHKIKLIGNVAVTQGTDSFQGDHIEYLVNQQIVTSTASAHNKTVITIPPQSH